MTRLPLALAGLTLASIAALASAQSYPQQYPMYGQAPMQQAPYGYGQMQPGMYPMPPAGGGYAMPPSGMYPSLPNGPGSYAGAGYPPGMMPPGVMQASMMQASMPQPMPQNIPPQQMSSANQSSGQKQSWPGQEYHGPQGAIAKANPPPMKLPPGVTSENGLLFYKGSPTADVNYQQFPAGSPFGSANRLASYQAGAENGANPNTSSVMNPGANSAGGMPSSGAANYGSSMQQGGNQCSGDCQNCDGGCDGCWPCSWLMAPYQCLCGICHGSFPGKVGYVWSAGYDSLAMTRDSGTSRTLLRLDTGSSPLPPIFNSNDLDFNWDYGGKVHFELIGPSGMTYQFAYTRIATFVTTDTLFSADFGGQGLTLPGTIASFSGFADADQASFYYSSSIQTGEFNVIFPFGSFEIVTGYRYMQVDEKSQILTFTGGSPATFVANSLNAMNGAQIGTMGRWEMFGLFDFDFDAKFAVMGDAARTQQNAVDATGSPVTTDPVVGTKTRVAFVSELGLQAVMPIGQSFSVHAGYNVFFIDRVALAPNQFDFNLGSSPSAGTFVNNHGDVVLQGVNVGFTAVW